MATSNNNVQIEVQFLTNKALRSVQKLHDSVTNTVNKTNRLAGTGERLSNAFKKARESSRKMQNDLKNADVYSKSMAESATIFAKAFVGVAMGTQFLEAAETYGSAVNKLNNINSQQLGANGVESYYDDTLGKNRQRYSSSTKDMTNKQLDQIYAAANRSRSNYSDMIGNVGKQALLAGDAFNNNMDNVIKFNELMAKAYAISGATAAEQSQSMMQLTQALGSGVMQGDELKSVREGATLAYQAIEDFAQEVYDTDESLKDLGAQGKVTSDLIVAAMLENADKLDKAMAMTEMTVGQFWTIFKNDAFKAFEPALKAFHEFVGKLAASPVYENIRETMFGVGKAVAMVFRLLSGLLDLTIKYKDVVMPFLDVLIWTITAVLVKALITIQIELVKTVAKFFKIPKPILAIIAAIALLYLIVNKVTGGTLQASTVIVGSLLRILSVITLIAGTILIFVNPILGAILLIVSALSYIGSAATFASDSVLRGVATIVGTVAQAGEIIVATSNWVWEECGRHLGAFKEACVTAWENVQTVFKNFCDNIVSYWDSMIGKLANTKLGKALGLEAIHRHAVVDLRAGTESVTGAYNDYLASHPNSVNIEERGDAAYSKWYSKTMTWGHKVQAGLNDFKEQFKPTGGLPLNYDSPDFTGALGDIGDTADNTDKISNQLGMVTEDLSYLKELAELEWKKEFTTANINVTMTNNNTIDNKADIGDIAVQFRDALVSQLNTVAAGSANYS